VQIKWIRGPTTEESEQIELSEPQELQKEVDVVFEKVSEFRSKDGVYEPKYCDFEVWIRKISDDNNENIYKLKSTVDMSQFVKKKNFA